MPFVVITKPAVGETTKKDLADTLIDNQEFLNDQFNSIRTVAGVINGSFETGTGADTAPTGWDLVITSGNSTNFETSATNTRHGKQAFSMTTPGSIAGGVTLTSTDFILVSEEYDYRVRFLLKSSIATSKVTVSMRYYDEAEVFISADTIYTSSTALPTSWEEIEFKTTPPATAKLAKIEIVGVDNTTAASNYFDGFEISRAVVVPTEKYYTSSTTLTVPVGVESLLFQIWGAGGGGGGSEASAATNAGSGGGAGGYVRGTRAVVPGETITITVGSGGAGGSADNNGTAGGNTSISAGFGTVTAIGGSGGNYPLSSTVVGGAGGTSSGTVAGDLALAGQAGSYGSNETLGHGYNGTGGSAPFGGSGGLSGFVAGSAATPGGGGAGGLRFNTGSSAGSAGAGGMVMLRYEVTT